MRLGYNTWSMAKVPYQTFIPGLHEIGYTAITISVVPGYGIGGQRTPNAGYYGSWSADDRKKIKSEFESRNLELSAIVGNASMVGDDDSQLQARLQQLRDAIDLCAELKPAHQSFVPTMNTTSGGHSTEFESRKSQLVQKLGDLSRYAASKGSVVCIEPHVGGAIDTPQRAKWLVDEINQDSCKIDFDISHFEVVGIPMEESIPQTLPLSRSVEIKDQNFRYADAGDPRPGWRVEGNGLGMATAPNGRPVEYQFLLGGEGDFDLPRYLRLVHDAGWTGAIGFEASVHCQARPTYDPLAAAQSTFHWMKSAWEQAGIPQD